MIARSLVSASLLLSIAGLVGCESARLGTPGAIAGRYIVTIGDADMTAAAFTSGELGERDPAAQDMLTVVELPIKEPVTAFAQTPVSNSALCPPTCLSVTRDGNYAFIVDYRGPAGQGARTIAELPIGNSVTAVNLSNPMNPGIAATIEVPSEPIAVGAHPTGAFVAVATHEPSHQIVIIPFADGSFTGEPAVWPLLGVSDSEGLKPSSIAWHPGGAALAVTLQERGAVMFYSFSKGDDGRFVLEPWGESIKVGLAPYSGAFTPDGRYFIVNDLQWPQGTMAYTAGTPQGKLITIRLGEKGAAKGAEGGDAGRAHEIAGEAAVGINPTALAISSDGKFVVTANMQHSVVSASSTESGGQTSEGGSPVTSTVPAGGSLSLLSINDDGTLVPAGEYPLSALPAGVSFDAKDEHICVTQFRSFDPEAIDGELGFWSLHRGEQPRLEAADFFVGVGKGPHGVLIVR